MSEYTQLDFPGIRETGARGRSCKRRALVGAPQHTYTAFPKKPFNLILHNPVKERGKKYKGKQIRNLNKNLNYFKLNKKS